MNVVFKFIKRYPLSLVVVAAILYLSFFNPPKEKIIHIDNLDKLAHFCMYAGFCSVVWFEYFFSHSGISYKRVFVGAVVAPIIFSGLIVLFRVILLLIGVWMCTIFCLIR